MGIESLKRFQNDPQKKVETNDIEERLGKQG